MTKQTAGEREASERARKARWYAANKGRKKQQAKEWHKQKRTRFLAKLAVKGLLTEREVTLIVAALQEKANRYRTEKTRRTDPADLNERAQKIAELNDLTDYIRAIR